MWSSLVAWIRTHAQPIIQTSFQLTARAHLEASSTNTTFCCLCGFKPFCCSHKKQIINAFPSKLATKHNDCNYVLMFFQKLLVLHNGSPRLVGWAAEVRPRVMGLTDVVISIWVHTPTVLKESLQQDELTIRVSPRGDSHFLSVQLFL